jgi:methionine--tRNA ligase beta chain
MTVTFEDFKKLDIRIGRVLSAERVEDTDKLIKLQIDLGTEKRQVVAGMADFLEPDHFIGKEVPVLTNLEPRTLRGVESQGMVLAAEVGGRPVLLLPEDEVPPGSVVR